MKLSGAQALIKSLEQEAVEVIFGLPGGSLGPGAPADLILVDLDEPCIVREADIRSRSKNTCFEGARMQGRVLQTMVAGRTVFSS